jgi:uncharacterized protein YggT (Ycf19 family)
VTFRPGLGMLDTSFAIAAAVIGLVAVFATLNNMYQWIW